VGVIEIRHRAGAFLRTTTIADVAESLASALVDQGQHLPDAGTASSIAGGASPHL
jgi:hypothetical protein